MKHLTFITFLSLAFFGFAGKPYNIDVKVVDLDLRTPIAGVRIDFISDKNLIVYFTYTDEDGKATLENCQKKVIKIQASPRTPDFSKTTYYYDKKYDEGTLVIIELTNFESYQNKIKELTLSTPIDSSHMVNEKECGDALIDAEFPGGQDGLAEFLKKNMRYPERALDQGVGGRCYLRFYIDQEGNISNISLPRRLEECPDCEYEAILVIKKMPKWIPGVCNGENIGMFYNLPIKFTPG